ncbi:MAG: hypothetical protein GX197_04580 [Firmicutes bacterium]|nr:hypothetical protein [Bacillota bacterium]
MSTDEKLKNKILDEMIKQALENHVNKINKQYPTNQELSTRYTFSAPFEKKDAKTI